MSSMDKTREWLCLTLDDTLKALKANNNDTLREELRTCLNSEQRR